MSSKGLAVWGGRMTPGDPEQWEQTEVRKLRKRGDPECLSRCTHPPIHPPHQQASFPSLTKTDQPLN